MEEGKTLELLSKIYGEMQNGFNSLNNKIDKGIDFSCFTMI